MKEVILGILKKAIKEKGVEVSEEEIANAIEIPPSVDMGDYAFPCFFLAGKFRESPKEVALELREHIKNIPKEFEDIQTSGPYINFFLNRIETAKKLIQDILEQNISFGKSDLGEGNQTMIEFSQPNTHKAFHVGHIRGTSFGESLSRIFEFSGEKIIRVNYSGDTGMHVAKWIWGYKKYHSKEKLKNDESWIASIYVDSVKRLSKNPKLQKEVDKINKQLEEGKDKKLNDLWKKTRKLSIDSWDKIYRDLNTKFDLHFFESEFEEAGNEIVQELLGKNIAIKSDGAIIVDLKNQNLGVWVLLRKDGTILYSAKDLALAKKKFSDFNINKNIYVVGAAQTLHFSQLFKTLELNNFEHVKDCIFIPFSEVRLPQGKMSSRTGENILYSDFIREITDYTKKEIKKRERKILKSELESRALRISIAAIKYSMLKQNPNKNIIFNKEDSLNFDGDTGPYILYSYARASSIIRKSKNKQKQEEISELEQKEIELVKTLSQFPEIVSNSYKSMNPSLIANYSYKLAQTFNEFYHSCPVIGSKNESFRLGLVQAFKQVLKNSLDLLGIAVLEKM